MRMYVAGEWVEAATASEVANPYSGEAIATVPCAEPHHVEAALAAASAGAADMARLTAWERSNILLRAADQLDDEVEALARLVSSEEGKPLAEARAEAARCPALLRLCAFEGAQLRGETLPLDAASNGVGKSGYTQRIPCGVVLCITPFNFPLLLVMHKIGPALAAGNAVILKPAAQTPLAALRLTEVLLEAGLPPLALQCITGAGADVGARLCADHRVRKITFTGSTEVGDAIARRAGVKNLSMELGANCPLIVLADGDIERAAAAATVSAFVNAGQVCLSTQRILVDRAVYADYLDALLPRVAAIRVGDPLDDGTALAAMISAEEAERVRRWISEAVDAGARVLTGGEREGAVVAPAVLTDVRPDMAFASRELFGPAVGVTRVDGIDEALALANDTRYGLAAGIYTRDIGTALRFAREAEVGNVNINGTPTWRADFMPYGGLKDSGIGKEGPRYAIEAMTESKTVVFHEVTM